MRWLCDIMKCLELHDEFFPSPFKNEKQLSEILNIFLSDIKILVLIGPECYSVGHF